MPNAERTAKLAGALRKGFGEAFTFTARKRQSDVDLPRVPDASRPDFQAIGVWSGGSRRKFPDARGSADNRAQAEVSTVPTVTVADADLDWHPIEGDGCKREEDGSYYTIARPMPNGVGHTKFYLTAKKR